MKRLVKAVVFLGFLALSVARVAAQTPTTCSPTATPNTAVVGQAVTINLASNCSGASPAVSGSWSIGSLSPAGAPQPVATAPGLTATVSGTFTQPGTYCYTFDGFVGGTTGIPIAQTQTCPGDSVPHAGVVTVTVSQAPASVCTISQTPANPVDGRTPVTLTASCTNNPTTYAWTANNAVVGTTPSITVTPAQTTTYSVVANNAAGPSQPVSVTVQVILPPVCTISQTPPNPVDGNTRVTLTASCSNNPTIYAWTAGGVNVGATPSITVTPTQTTTYTLAATGPGGTGQATQTVQVNRVVAASIVVIAGSTTATAGKSLPAPLLARVLDGSNNPVGAGISVTWTSTDPGDTFAPQATVLTDNTGTASVNVTLSANPADRQIKACVTGTAVCSANTLLRSIQEAVLKPAAQLVGPQAAVANMAALTQLSNIRARLDERRRLQNPTVAQGLRVSHFGTMLPQMRSYALASVDQEGKPIARTDVPANANQDSFERFGLFVDGALEIGKQSSTGVQTGFDVHSNGLTIGGDYRLGGNHVIGAALGLLRASTDLDQSAGTQDARGYSFSIFGSFVPMADGYIDVIANIGRNTYDSTRHALDNSQGITSDFSSSTSGNQYALSASAGYNFNKAALTLNPYVRADFIKATVNSFSESGGQNNQGAISVGDQQYQNTFLTLGGQLSYAMSMSWGVFIPNARLELQHQSRASTKDVSAQLVSDATTNSLVPLVQSDKSFGNYALGFSAVFQRGVSAFFNYQRTFGKDNFSDAKYTLGVRAEF